MIQVVLIEKQIITWKGVSKKFKNISLLREFFARFNFACFTRASGVKNHGKMLLGIYRNNLLAEWLRNISRQNNSQILSR